MMDRLSFSIFAITQFVTHAFVPATFPHLGVRATGMLMCSSPADEGMSRGEVLRSVAAACVAGSTAWSTTAIGVSAKAPAPVMKLPDADDSVKPALRSGGEGSIPPFTVLPSGVQITDIVAGDGPVADAGKGVTLKWVMRRSNGYYVSSSEEGGGEPFIYRVGDAKRAIKGLDDGIRGMKSGGTRRIVVPPELGYVEGCKDGNPGPIPMGLGPKQQINTRNKEPLTFEVKLTKVR
ncbi:unnamed protein product [Ectocarpus sp. 13 AM-2016]